MNIDNLTTAEINFVKNMLSGLTNEQIIADQTSKTISDSFEYTYSTMISMGYEWGWTAGRSKVRTLFLKGKSNFALINKLNDEFRANNEMQLLWVPDRMVDNEYEFKVERNTRRSYIKVASQLVERGLIREGFVTNIMRGEGIAEALIKIREM